MSDFKPLDIEERMREEFTPPTMFKGRIHGPYFARSSTNIRMPYPVSTKGRGGILRMKTKTRKKAVKKQYVINWYTEDENTDSITGGDVLKRGGKKLLFNSVKEAEAYADKHVKSYWYVSDTDGEVYLG